MTKYTEAALITAKRCQGQGNPDVKREWTGAITELNAYNEICPRSAFIGLCEAGMVKGIPSGNYGLRKNSKNKRYAIDAAHLLLTGHEPDSHVIWRKVTDSEICPHDQINIVLALHDEGLLVEPGEPLSKECGKTCRKQVQG